MSLISLHKAISTDLDRLRDISIATFLETYAAQNTEANMIQYVDRHFSHDQLSLELNDPRSVFYLATDADRAIGYIKINFAGAQTDFREEDGAEIERIYVLKEYFGRQVGRLLLEKALETVRDSGKRSVWLGVWENNHRAIGFYEKQGFQRSGTHVFRLGEDEQTDHVMRLEL